MDSTNKPKKKKQKRESIQQPENEDSEDEDHETKKILRNLAKASEGTIRLATQKEYSRQWKHFKEFCVRFKFKHIKSPDAIEELLKEDYFPEDLPQFIAAWIMEKCDDTDIRTGNDKGLKTTRAGYQYATKMRAAISHKFGRELKLGAQPWVRDQEHPGFFTGNPSLSPVLAHYMVSLHRKKAQAGERATSARAIDKETLKKLVIFNHDYPKAHETATLTVWAGHSICQMLNLMYIVSFLCLLCLDEALRLKWHWVSFERVTHKGKVTQCVVIRLPFRKTHQTGGIAPFILYPNDEKPWLCPVCLFAQWAALCRTPNGYLTGYIFRKKTSALKFDASGNIPMSSFSFMECFRHNLMDVDIESSAYGKHSFWRGGCQYLHLVLWWPLCKICEWGGWADNFDNPGTIFKYLLSFMDNPSHERKDFFNPFIEASEQCTHCGRSCLCC